MGYWECVLKASIEILEASFTRFPGVSRTVINSTCGAEGC